MISEFFNMENPANFLQWQVQSHARLVLRLDVCDATELIRHERNKLLIPKRVYRCQNVDMRREG